MIAFAVAIAAAFAFAAAADVYDINRTLKVVDRGLALEANDWLVGSKPTHKGLYLRDALTLAAVAGPLVVTLLIHAAAGAAPGMLIFPVVFAIKHIHGGKVNAGVLAGKPVPDPYTGPRRSAWWLFWHNW